MIETTTPTAKDQARVMADLKEITLDDWQPIETAETTLYLEGKDQFPPGSLWCMGKRGTVFVQAPDGKLTVCLNVHKVSAH